MGQDKKVRDGRLAFILARDIGAAFVSRDVDLAAVRALLAEALED
jgi:3-dehydroquinate synthase